MSLPKKIRTKLRTIPPGSLVRSSYSAQWYGRVVCHDGPQVTVMATHDRTGRPLRKHKVRRLHCDWLDSIEKIPEVSE